MTLWKKIPRDVAACPVCSGDLFVLEFDCSYGNMVYCLQRETVIEQHKLSLPIWRKIDQKVANWVKTLPPKIQPVEEEP